MRQITMRSIVSCGGVFDPDRLPPLPLPSPSRAVFNRDGRLRASDSSASRTIFGGGAGQEVALSPAQGELD
jgi:hypothetical protein